MKLPFDKPYTNLPMPVGDYTIEYHYDVFNRGAYVYSVWAADEAAARKAGEIHWDTAWWTVEPTGRTRMRSERPAEEFRGQ